MAGSRGPSVFKRGSLFFQFSRIPKLPKDCFKFSLQFLRRSCCFAIVATRKTPIFMEQGIINEFCTSTRKGEAIQVTSLKATKKKLVTLTKVIYGKISNEFRGSTENVIKG